MKFSYIVFMFSTCLMAFHSRMHGGELPEKLDECVAALETYHESKTFLTIREEFRDRLKSDSDGLLVKKLLEAKDLRGMLYANMDAAPKRFHEIILATHLLDDSQWYSQGGLFRSPSSGIANSIIEIFNISDAPLLSVALEDAVKRKSISLILSDLARKIENSAGKSQELRDLAKNEILKIVPNPAAVDAEAIEREKKRPERPITVGEGVILTTIENAPAATKSQEFGSVRILLWLTITASVVGFSWLVMKRLKT